MRLWIIILLLLTLNGCSTTEELETNKSAEQLYLEGITALNKKRYKTASTKFQEVDQKHPFSPWATRAQVNIIYSKYREEEFDEAVSATERFIRLHPRNSYASYAYYMRGLSFYKQISSAKLDQGRTKEAYIAFQELIQRYPKSDYALEAKQMLVLCRDRMAEQEVVVARYYMDEEEYIASINRFNRLLKNPLFKTTPYKEEALFSLTFSSMRLGLKEDARNYASVLGHNFPDGAFYLHAKNIVENNQDLNRSQVANLRKDLSKKSAIRSFFQGLAPALVNTQQDY